MTKTSITSRPVRDDDDFWRVRDLLTRTLPAAPAGHNWDVRRWDGAYFYSPSGRWEGGWEQHVRLWETAGGELVGCANWGGLGEAWIQIDPAYRCLEPEMIDWAEAHLAAPRAEGAGRSLEWLVFEYDALRRRLLAERGYEKLSDGGMCRHMRLPAAPLPAGELPAPYHLREIDAESAADCQGIADILNAAFRRTFHNGAEFRAFAQHAPCYVRDLDVVAVAPDGAFAAYVGMPLDARNGRAVFEPVCTHPEHRRKGLAAALMRQALRRARALGAVSVTVDTGDMIPANALYDSLGFTEAYKAYYWRKTWWLDSRG